MTNIMLHADDPLEPAEEQWTAADARSKFHILLDRAVRFPQIIVPQRGKGGRNFVCLSQDQWTSIREQIAKLKAENERLALQLRRQRTEEALGQIQALYTPGEDFEIKRKPARPVLDFGGDE